jgi:uncharacterized protein YkwD
MKSINQGWSALPKFHRRFPLLLITILGGVAVVAGQDTKARPVARLVATFESESKAPANAASPPKQSFPSAANLKTNKDVAPPPEAGAAEAVLSAETADMERRVFALVNEVRAKQGLPLLAWDEKLAQLARDHSANMARTRFFNHVDPQGRDTMRRAREAGVKDWRALSENIAYNKGFDQPAEFAVERWLVSPKHHENMAQPLFTQTGIGVAKAADGRFYFTQVFLGR